MKSKVYSKLHRLLSLMAIVWMAFVPASMYAASVPTNVHVNGLAPISATLAWEIEGTDRHDYDLRVATSTLTSTELGAATVGNPASVVIAENAITLTEPEYAMSGLTAGTHYYVYIRENAGWDYGQSSNWATYEFSTPCEATAELPIAANFDGSSTIPTCWSTGGNAPTVVGSVHRGESGNSVKISPTSESGSYLYSPVLASNAGAYYLTAYVYGAAGADYAIGIAATEDLLNVQAILEGKISQANTWTFIDAAIPADLQATLEGGVEYVWVFYAEASNNAVNFYVDDIEITAMPPCISPSIPVVSDMTANSAVLSWTERGSAAAWVVEYTNSTDNQIVETSENPLLLNELLSNTTYAVRIKSVCGEESESEWTAWVSFKTECGTVGEFIEDFNSITTGIPECWNNSLGTTTSESYKWSYDSGGHTGACLRFDSYFNASGNTNILLTPYIYSEDALMVRFYCKNPAGGDFSVFVTEDGGTTLIPLESGITSLSEWTLKECVLPAAYSGHTYQIAFKGTSNYEYGDAYIYLDDVEITKAPTCPKPSNLEVTSIDIDKITLGWTPIGSETAWTLTYQLGEEDVVSVSVNGEPFYEIDGLTAATTYTLSSLSLQAICSETDQSTVAVFGDLTVNTTCVAIADYSTDFEDETTDMLPPCWTRVSTSNASYPRVSESNAHSGTKSLYAYAYYEEDDWGYEYYIAYSGITALPELNANAAGYRLSFWAKSEYNYSYEAAQIAIGVMTDVNDTESFTSIQTITLSTSYQEFMVDLSSYNGVGRFVAIKYLDVQKSVYIDDIILEEIPSCERPANIESSAKNATTVLVTITDTDASHTAWEVAVGEAGFNPDEAEAIAVSAKQTTITLPFSMEAGASYGIAVRTVCSATEKSAWRNGANMTYTDWSFLNSDMEFVTSAAYPWTLSQEDGVWKAISGNEGIANSTSTLMASFEVEEGSKVTLTFSYEVGGEISSGSIYDYLVIFVDDACDNPSYSSNYDEAFGKKAADSQTISGEWSIEFKTSGTHRVMWMYRKDGSANGDVDKAIVSNITLSTFNCVEPTSFTTGVITANSAVLNWNNTNAGHYQVLFFTEEPSAISEDAAQSNEIITTNNKTFEGLEANHQYFVAVRSLCGEEPYEYSDWSALKSFRTECEAQAIPYSEDFEDEGAILCWKVIGEPAYISPVSTSVFEGAKAVQVQSDSVGLLLITPRFDVESLADYELSLAVKSNKAITLSIGAILDPTDIGTFVPLNEVSVSSLNSWNEYTVPLSALAEDEDLAGAQYLAIQMPTYTTLQFDAVAIEVASTCPQINDVVVSNVSANSANLAWSEVAGATYEVLVSTLYSHKPDTIAAEHIVHSISTTTNAITLTELTPSSVYYAYVRALCGEEDYGKWSNAIDFNTLLGVPYAETFNHTTLPANWTRMSGDPVAIFGGEELITTSGGWGLTTSSYGLPANHARINIYSSTNNRWLVSPIIDMTSVDPESVVACTFDFAYTGYNSASSASTSADQALLLLVSEDGGTTWSAANGYEWSHSDSIVAKVYKNLGNISNTGTTIRLTDFGRFAGKTIQLAFVARTTSGDNDFHIANLHINILDDTCLEPSGVQAVGGDQQIAISWEGDAAKASVVEVSQGNEFTTLLRVLQIEEGRLDTVVDGLESNTKYYVRVKQICSPTKETGYSSIASATTQCGVMTSLVEGFESMTIGNSSAVAPECWALLNANDGSYPYIYVNNSSLYVHSGTKSLYFQSSSSRYGYAILPAISGLNTKEMEFYYKDESTTSSGRLWLGYMTDITDEATFIEIAEFDRSTSWQRGYVDFTALDAVLEDGIRLAFKYGGSSSSNYFLGIDDISIITKPSCYALDQLLTMNVQRRQFDVVMIPKDDHIPASYDLVISETALDDEAREAAVMTLADSIYHATGLTRATTYYVYARANCGEGDVSEWKELLVTTHDLVEEQDILVADGTTTNSYLPINSLWTDTYGTHMQSIYPESMLINLVGYTFTGLQYYATGTNSSWTDAVFEVRIMQTQTSTMGSDFVDVTGATLVYTGTVTVNPTDGMLINLTTPFTYTGGNLLIDFIVTVADYYNTVNFYGMSTSEYVSRSRTTNYQFLPKVSFICQYAVESCPAVEVESISHDLTGDGTSSAIIRWGASDGDYANTYDLYYATEPVEDWEGVEPQFTELSALSQELTGLTENTDYYVYLRVKCDAEGHDDGTSNWSDAYVFRTFANCQALSGLYVELLGKTSAQANWNATVQAPNFQYILSEEELDAEDLETAQLTEAGLVDTFAVMQDLTLGTTYYLYVANRCGEEEENHSVYVSTSFTMPAGCPAVENLEAYYKAFNAVGLKWNRGRFGEESEWEVGIVGEEASAQAVYDSTAIIIGLQPSTDYTFYVKAVCGVEDSSTVVTLAVRTNPLPSDYVTVADGTTTNSYLPVYGYYCDDPQRTQSVYPASMLTNLVGQTITGLHYYVLSGGSLGDYGSWENAVFTVRLGITTSANLASGWATETLTAVYTGTLTASVADGMTVTFDTPFEYTGGNLVIEFDLPEESGYSRCSFYGITATSASRYVYGDYSYPNGAGTVQSFLPQIEFEYVSQVTCRQAANVQVTDITINSAKLTWFPGGSEVEWAMINSDVELSDAELNSMEADTLDAMEKTYEGLTPGLFYHFYIRSLCSEDEASAWTHIQYRTIPTCNEPVMAEPLLIDADSVVLTWTNGNETFEGTYSLAFGLSANFNLADAETYTLIENIADDQYIIHGLSGSSKYRVAVKAVCTDDDESIWSEPIEFWSACERITNLPFVEDFNEWQGVAETYNGRPANAILPNCWSADEQDDAYVYVTNSSSYAVSGNGLLFVGKHDNSSRDSIYVYMPSIEAAGAVVFTAKYRHENPDYGKFVIGYVTTPEDASTFVAVATLNPSSSFVSTDKIVIPSVDGIVYPVIKHITQPWYYASMDSIVISKLAVAATYYDQTCSGTAYQGHGFDIPASQVVVGEHTFTRVEEATSDLMADSLYTLVLNVGESKVTYLTDTACAYSAYDDYGFHIGSVNPNRTTPYERHEATVTGCDSLISLTLFVPQREFEVSDAICEGQEYQLGDTTLTTSGTYTRTLTGARFGCDSVVTLTLEVLPAHEEIEATICEGESYPFGGEDRTEAGTYEATLVNRLGCEYTVTLTLAVTEKTYYNYEAVFCAGDIYSDENFSGLDEGGIYKDTLSSVAGCDSIIVLNLIKHEPEEVDLNIEIADGDVYVFDNKTFDHDTTYTAHFVDQFSCDSIVTLHLTVATGLQEVLNDAQLKAAEKFMHNGILYIRANGILYDARGKRIMIRKEEE